MVRCFERLEMNKSGEAWWLSKTGSSWSSPSAAAIAVR